MALGGMLSRDGGEWGGVKSSAGVRVEYVLCYRMVVRLGSERIKASKPPEQALII